MFLYSMWAALSLWTHQFKLVHTATIQRENQREREPERERERESRRERERPAISLLQSASDTNYINGSRCVYEKFDSFRERAEVREEFSIFHLYVFFLFLSSFNFVLDRGILRLILFENSEKKTALIKHSATGFQCCLNPWFERVIFWVKNSLCRSAQTCVSLALILKTLEIIICFSLSESDIEDFARNDGVLAVTQSCFCTAGWICHVCIHAQSC